MCKISCVIGVTKLITYDKIHDFVRPLSQHSNHLTKKQFESGQEMCALCNLKKNSQNQLLGQKFTPQKYESRKKNQAEQCGGMQLLCGNLEKRSYVKDYFSLDQMLIKKVFEMSCAHLFDFKPQKFAFCDVSFEIKFSTSTCQKVR